ncbi:MAG: AI-2E family transporter [Alphaproteobacteria bacterium]
MTDKQAKIFGLSIIRAAAIFALAVMITWILIVGKSILQPFVVAMLLFLFITSLANVFARIKIAGKGLPVGLPTLLAFIIIFGAVVVVISVFVSVSISELISKWEGYKEVVTKMVGDLDGWAVVHLQKITGRSFDIDSTGPVVEALNSINVSGLVTRFQQALSNAASFFGLMFLFLVFLVLEQRVFHRKLDALFPDGKQRSNIDEILLHIREGVFSYLQVKTFISALTGIATYAILRLFKVDFAEFWAVLTFILNYIPNIGSFLAVVLTSIAALVQLNPMTVGVLFICLTAVQQFLGGYLDPKISGDRLNLSPLVIIFALVFWGKIWGILGAFFCVPLTAMMNIILANFKSTRPVAILLSSKGYIFSDKDKEEAEDSDKLSNPE